MEEDAKAMNRRKFFSALSTAAFSLVGAFAAIVGVGFLYPVGKRKVRPLFVCLESEVPDDHPLEIKDPRGRKVLIMRRAGGALVAFGTVCPHLGCSVYYRPKADRFECPCHQGVFDGNGDPISGPPQGPLQRYATEIREGKVFIQFT